MNGLAPDRTRGRAALQHLPRVQPEPCNLCRLVIKEKAEQSSVMLLVDILPALKDRDSCCQRAMPGPG